MYSHDLNCCTAQFHKETLCKDWIETGFQDTRKMWKLPKCLSSVFYTQSKTRKVRKSLWIVSMKNGCTQQSAACPSLWRVIFHQQSSHCFFFLSSAKKDSILKSLCVSQNCLSVLRSEKRKTSPNFFMHKKVRSLFLWILFVSMVQSLWYESDWFHKQSNKILANACYFYCAAK